jgi:NADH:ubiquinone oxidoreductase subunit F (NADH-binding)
VTVFRGPREYLYGEETGLLEAVAGRPPFPRIAPPWRRGATEVVDSAADADSESGLAAPVLMAGETDAPPALVNNVETLANVPGIVANGADWFRTLGTDESPGTIVCTVTGSTRRAGVAEIPMGTPLRTAIVEIGGGLDVGREVSAVLMGVANAALIGDQLDTPMTYEAMRDAGSGLGSAGAIVLGDDVDLLAAAVGVARFLAVESCGQCTPCKQDGLAIASRLQALCTGTAEPGDAEAVGDLLATVADGARCALAGQQQSATGSLVALAGQQRRQRTAERDGDYAEPLLVAELVDIVDGRAVYDEEFVRKQPDWTYDEVDSGQSPVDRLTDRRAD